MMTVITLKSSHCYYQNGLQKTNCNAILNLSNFLLWEARVVAAHDGKVSRFIHFLLKFTGDIFMGSREGGGQHRGRSDLPHNRISSTL